MSAAPVSPFGDLLDKLTQAMSAPGSPPVRHELSTQRDAAQTGDDRVEWNPVGVDNVIRPFNFSDSVTPTDQACDFDVNVYGSSFDRALQIHALLLAWLDLIFGPEQGCPPSDDAADASGAGTVDLTSLLYPTSVLDGLTLDFLIPLATSIAMPAGPFADPVALVVGINNALRAAGSPVLATFTRDRETGAIYARLVLPADVVSADAPTIALDPDTATSACAALGFDGTPIVGSAPTRPYRPGFKVGKFAGPAGGNVSAGSWGLSGPVRLFLPVRSVTWIPVAIQKATMVVSAATSTGENIAVETL